MTGMAIENDPNTGNMINIKLKATTEAICQYMSY